jgi:hypothetical protein
VEIVAIAALSAALSLTALVVSVLLAWRHSELHAVSQIVARRHGDLQARVAALEEARRAEEAEAAKRARVTASFDPSFFVLRLTNDGPSVARGVTVKVRPIGDGAPPALDPRDLPADLRPGQDLFVDAQHPSPACAATITATVHWTDDTGPRQETFVLGTD